MINQIDEWIIEADIKSMQTAMEQGELSSEQLVQAYLNRIAIVDTRINAILEVNPDAMEIARSLDIERKDKGSRGPMHGIPILLKDNIDTGDRMHTSAGSLALANSYATEDSFVASQLRKAGAVLLGKTNMTEWANFMSNSMECGYSSRGGQVLNPYGPGDVYIGGSSSGSGAAIAANLGAGAIGTETSGSIICPASQNSLVGLKPTVGLISQSGIIPISASQDAPGPMTRTVTDTALLLGAMTGEDYTQFLDSSYLRKARIGIPRYFYKDLDEERLALMEAAIVALQNEGVTIIDSITLPAEEEEMSYTVMRYEFKDGLNAYLSKLDDDVPIHSLADLIAFNKNNEATALKYGQDLLEWCEEISGSLIDPTYLEARAKDIQLTRAQGIDYLLNKYELDALLIPEAEGPDFAAKAGYPLLTVPAGYTTKGPLGITFSGKAFSEPVLIQLAYGYEQVTKHRKSPGL